MKFNIVMCCLLFLLSEFSYSQISAIEESEIVIKNDGWNLIGDLTKPSSKGVFPAVLMLNKAADDRHVYKDLAMHLAKRGIASLRLDLRGHGSSTNLGKFIPYKNNPDPLIWDAEQDVIAAFKYLKAHPNIDSTKLGSVGASYSGEEMAEAGRLSGYVQAYVELSPGSFSDESINGIDSSGVPWLFIVSRNERHLTEVTQLVRENSKEVELLVIPGTHHATRILENYNGMAERIAVWLASKL